MSRCKLCQSRHKFNADCALGEPPFTAWAYLHLELDQEQVHVCPCPDLVTARMVRDYFWDLFGGVAGAAEGLPPIPSGIPTTKHRVYRLAKYHLPAAQQWAAEVGWIYEGV